MKVLSGCAMLESRDDPIPGPRGGGQSGAGEARGGQGRPGEGVFAQCRI